MMVAAGMAPPAMGLMTVPVGGTMLEEWSSPETQAKVKNVTCMCSGDGCDSYQPLGPACVGNSAMWFGNTQPFVNITIKLHLYYQGENNLQFDGGNSAQGTGYAALFPQMIEDWRAVSCRAERRIRTQPARCRTRALAPNRKPPLAASAPRGRSGPPCPAPPTRSRPLASSRSPTARTRRGG